MKLRPGQGWGGDEDGTNNTPFTLTFHVLHQILTFVLASCELKSPTDTARLCDRPTTTVTKDLPRYRLRAISRLSVPTSAAVVRLPTNYLSPPPPLIPPFFVPYYCLLFISSSPYHHFNHRRRWRLVPAPLQIFPPSPLLREMIE